MNLLQLKALNPLRTMVNTQFSLETVQKHAEADASCILFEQH